MSKNKSRDELDRRRRSLWFSSIPLKAGFSNLSFQVYAIVFLGFLLSLGGNIAYSYLAMFLAGKAQTGGLAFDPSIVGLMLTIGGLAGTLTLPFAGHLCDRFGRRKLMLSSLIPRIVLTLGFAYAHSYAEFLLLYMALSIMSAFYSPAYSAMIADLVEPEKREQVYGLSYMIGNVGWMVGYPIGGLIASMSGYSPLFIYCAAFTSAAAGGFALLIKESKPGICTKSSHVVASIFKDRTFLLFCLMFFLTNFVYVQFYNLLSVYTEHLGFEPYVFGILSSIAGAMVVVLQIPIRQGTVRIGPTKAFIVAQMLFALGFVFFMFASNFAQFVVAIAVLTLGEIMFYPATSAFAVNLAPVEMRGEYIAVSSLFSGIGGSTASVTLFSLYGILADKSMVWGICGLLGFAFLPGYWLLFKVAHAESPKVRASS
jgi:MFS family permease